MKKLIIPILLIVMIILAVFTTNNLYYLPITCLVVGLIFNLLVDNDEN